MGPIGSKVIEVKGQIYVFFLLVMFFCLFCLHRRNHLTATSSIEVKGQIYGFFSVCSPTSPRSLGRSSQNLVGRLRAASDIISRGSFLKVKVIEVKGQISVSRQSLVRFA